MNSDLLYVYILIFFKSGAAAAAAGAVVPNPAAAQPGGGTDTMIAPTLVAAPSLIPSALAGKASQIRKLYKALL